MSGDSTIQPLMPGDAERIQARWIAEALAGPLAEVLLPQLLESLRARPPIERGSYRVEEVAERLGTSRSKVYDLINRGELPSYTIDRVRLIHATTLEAYIARQEAKQTAALAASGAMSPEALDALRADLRQAGYQVRPDEPITLEQALIALEHMRAEYGRRRSEQARVAS